MSSGGNWIARTHGSRYRHRGPRERFRFESGSRREGGQSGGVTPVPIPNTEVKPTSVPGSTGVSDPLGTAVRRLPIHTTFTDYRETSVS